MFKIKIRKNLLIIPFIIFTIPLLDIGYFQQFELLETIRRVFLVVIFSVLVLIILVYRISISRITYLIIFSQIYLFIITLSYGNSVFSCMTRTFQIACMLLLYEVGYNISSYSFIKSQLICFWIIIPINLISEIFFPMGMYEIMENGFLAERNFFLGYYNRLLGYFLPALMLSSLYKHMTGKKKANNCMIILVIISSFLSGSGSVRLSMTAMIIAYIFKTRSSLFNYFTYWILQPVFFVLVVILSYQGRIILYINKLLGKQSSFNWRVRLWNVTIPQVMKHPIFGHGFVDRMYRVRISGLDAWAGYAHNGILETLYKGGVLYLLFLIMTIISCGNILKKSVYKKAVMEIAIPFLGWSVACFTDGFFSPVFIILFIIAYYHEKALGNSNSVLYQECETQY